MPCNHKFQPELELEEPDFAPVTLIVGAFIPSWPTNNVEWFYGRTAKNWLWDVLPRLYGEASLIEAGASEWKQFCSRNRIAFTDLISSIDDAEENNAEHAKILGGFSDKAIDHNFEDLEFVNIVHILKRHPSIKHVYITRSVTDAFWRHLWNPVAHYCSANKLHERKLLTPTNEALYHQEAFNREHPEHTISRLEDYILMRWQEEWHG